MAASVDSGTVAFSAFQPSLQDSSQEMMAYVRETLQQAQEITTVVDEAERVAEEARRFAVAIGEEHAHEERQRPTTRHMYKFRKPSARAAEKLGEKLAGVPAPIASGMTKQIQLSVLWTQQMLELVNMSQSAEMIEPGARLQAAPAKA